MAEGYEEPPKGSLQLQIVSLPHINNLTLGVLTTIPDPTMSCNAKVELFGCTTEKKARGRKNEAHGLGGTRE